MESQGKKSRVGTFLITMASIVVIIAGMRAAGSLLVPFLLSFFIAIICAPFLFWMRKKKIPDILAILSILIIIITIGLLLSVFVGASVKEFTNQLPFYQKRLVDQTSILFSWLKELGVQLPQDIFGDYFDPAKVMKMIGYSITGLSGMITNVFMIILTVIFILLEVSIIPEKLQTVLPRPEESLEPFSQFMESVNRYLALKTVFSLMTGFAIWIWLSVQGVNHALLWGLVAFLLNYVPNIGSFISAIPAVLLAMVQLGVGSAFVTCLGYLIVNILFGSILEPRFMGRGLGLSTLIVFLSLVFWGWVLGPVGMVLSVPLTMILKIGLESNEDTRWIALLMGSPPAKN